MSFSAEYGSCNHQEMTWWTERCNDCDHGLAVHRVVPVGDTSASVCDMCALAAQVITAATEFAVGIRDEVKQYGDRKQDIAKEYIDAQIADTRKVAKDYVDGVANGLGEGMAANQSAAKTYVDNVDSKIRQELPAWVNNRMVQVIKPTSFVSDPRTTP